MTIEGELNEHQRASDLVLKARKIRNAMDVLSGVVATEKSIAETKSRALSGLRQETFEVDASNGEIIVAEFDTPAAVWEYPVGNFYGETTIFFATGIELDGDEFRFINGGTFGGGSTVSIHASELDDVQMRIGTTDELPEDGRSWLGSTNG